MRTLIAALALTIPTLAQAALPVGSAAPDFATKGAKAGKSFDFRLSTALKKGPVVLYFFPAAFTPGCTIEARKFAEAADDFAKAGATLIGAAADPIDKLAKFSVEECRSKFPVAVATPAMIAGYDVVLPQLAGRSNRTSYVIGQNGRVAYVHSDMAPDGHITGTLTAVRALKKGK
jgi:thioredoxin-dependent peroxiredoxin